MPRKFSWICVMAVVAPGCANEPTQPDAGSLLALDPIVSNAIDPTAATAVRGAPAFQANQTGTVAYVSFVPGSVPRGAELSVRNASTGSMVTAPMMGGGVDPLAIAATEGDELEITATDSGSARYQHVEMVRARVPPRVVRTMPGPSQTDIPLNVRIQVVFSEPVTLESAEQGIRLQRGSEVVAGTVETVPGGSPVVLVFVPVAELAPSATYQLTIDVTVEDLSGDALATGAGVEFTTGAPTARPLPEPLPRGMPPLLFTSRADGYVYHGHSSGTTRIARPTWCCGGATWLPDGNRIAFVDIAAEDSTRADVVVVNLNGTNRTRLIRAANNAAWSPDGMVAFTGINDGQLYVANADGATPVRLTNGLDRLYERPVWSPDGRRLAFSGELDGYIGIYVIQADGSGVRLVVANQGGSMGAPAWSPDGTRIVFAGRQVGAEGIFVVNVDGSEFSLLVDARPFTTRYRGIPTFYAFADPSWSQDGRLLAFTATPCDYDWCYGSEVWVRLAERPESPTLFKLPDARYPAFQP
jgi:hypothetical protein